MSISLAPHACQIPQKTAGAAGLRQRVEKPWKIFLMIATLPWPCLQAAIEQILQESDEVLQEKQLQEWQRLKTLELRDVSFVGTLIASVVVGSIQWGALEKAHWSVWACWYGTLVLSLVSVMLAFYLGLLLSNFAINPSGNKLLLKALHMSKNTMRARWASLFALQVPIMLLSYALMAYIIGLALLIFWPLWSDPWGPMSWIAVVFGVCLIFATATFVSVCHFIYVQNEEVLKTG